MKSGFKNRRRILLAFSLVEIMVVMVIIGILLGIVIFAGTGAMRAAADSRAKAEINSMGNAMQAYIGDNGVPPASPFPNTPNYLAPTSTTDANYVAASQLLFSNLAGKPSYYSPALTSKSYMSFYTSEVGFTGVASPTAVSYVKDPFGYPYGYSTGMAGAPPNSGAGSFDIWSSGGPLPSGAPPSTNAWIMNW